MKIITDKEKVKQVLARGVEKIYPNREVFEQAMLSGKRIRLYCGFDPSAPSLHIGNAISLMKLGQFQELGHEVIFLIGDFTGMIGDPTDKTAARKKMTRQEVLKNAKNYKKQASAYLKFSGVNPAKVMYNSKWHDKLSFKDLIEVASNFTVQQMLARDMFQVRLHGAIWCINCGKYISMPKEWGTGSNNPTCLTCGNNINPLDPAARYIGERPIYLHEFLYPVAQGYDSVAMEVDLEIGGNDQTFNMLCGRDLMKAVRNKEKYVLTMKLLVDASGKKMGKTEGNIVNLDETPENMYGQVMSWPDGVIEAGMELCTNLDMTEIGEMAKKIKFGANPRDAKMKLAYEVAKINYGEKRAKAAEDYFVKTVQKKELPINIPEEYVEFDDENMKGVKLIWFLVESKLANSGSEARRLIKENAIKVDGEVVNDINYLIPAKTEGVIVQRGNRQFIRVIKK